MKRALIALTASLALLVFSNSVFSFTPYLYPATFADGSPVDVEPLGTRHPLILVHGINSDPSAWNYFIQFLLQDRYNALYESSGATSYRLLENFKPYFFKYGTRPVDLGNDPDAPTSIAEVGQAFGQALEALYALPQSSPDYGFGDSAGSRSVYLVAHSMGGLVSRSMMQTYGFANGQRGGERVASLITIATPHHGTPLADLASIGARHFRGATDGAMSFVLGMAWDNYDNLHLLNRDCNPWLANLNSYQPATDGDYSSCKQQPVLTAADGFYGKIIAYGSGTISEASPYIEGYDYLQGGPLRPRFNYDSDGVVPVQSALFAGNSAVVARLLSPTSPCDHSEVLTNPTWYDFCHMCPGNQYPYCYLPDGPLYESKSMSHCLNLDCMEGTYRRSLFADIGRNLTATLDHPAGKASGQPPSR